MNILDARDLGAGDRLETSVCVIGSGIAGVTVASRLADAGLDVLVLESGDAAPDPETQALYDVDSTGYPQRENFMSRARYLGGSCNLWAGRSMRLTPDDLERHATANAGWPVAFAEIERHYAEAGRVLGLPGANSFNFTADSPALSPAEATLLRGGLAPTVSVWAPKPKRVGGRRPTWLRTRPRARLVLNANAVGFETDDGDRRAVRTVRVRTLDGTEFGIGARAFVLACGGIENARLLMVPNGTDAEGLGNRFDQAGRYFMDHPRAIFGTVRLREGVRLPLLGGRPVRDGKIQIGLGFDERTRREEGVLNHYVTLEATRSDYVAQGYDSAVHTAKVLLRRGYAGKRTLPGRARLGRVDDLMYLLTPKELLPHWAYRGLVSVRDRLRRGGGSRDRTVVYFCEQPPDPESRVLLSREPDRLGLPRVELRWRIGDEVIESLKRLQTVLANRLSSTELGTLTPGEGDPRFTDASHHIGTTRMSDSEQYGVVDADCRVHGTENLFVAGSSVFPSAGHANPTLTIVGLSLRLAEHLAARTS